MASSAAAAASEDLSEWGYAKPTDGGVYVLKEGTWYCCICKAFAPESHLCSKNHLWYLKQHLEGKLHIAPPPPPGQPADDRPGPPPPRGQAHTAAAVSEESVMLINAKLAIVLDKLHTKLDMILEKLESMETRLAGLECQTDDWSWE